jgi:hypothetical protein
VIKKEKKIAILQFSSKDHLEISIIEIKKDKILKRIRTDI